MNLISGKIDSEFFNNPSFINFLKFQKNFCYFQSLEFLKYISSIEEFLYICIFKENKIIFFAAGAVNKTKYKKILKIVSNKAGFIYSPAEEMNVAISHRLFFSECKKLKIDSIIYSPSTFQELLDNSETLLRQFQPQKFNVQFLMYVPNNYDYWFKNLNSKKRNDISRACKNHLIIDYYLDKDFSKFIEAFTIIDNSLFSELQSVQKIHSHLFELLGSTIINWEGYIARQEKENIAGVLFFTDKTTSQSFYFYSSFNKNFNNTGAVDLIITEHVKKMQANNITVLNFMNTSMQSPVFHYKRKWSKEFHLIPVYEKNLSKKAKINQVVSNLKKKLK